MVRRSFRIGLRLGLLVGATFALVKTVQSRRSSSKEATPPAPWEPLVDRATPTPAATPSEAASTDEPLVDEVGEPVMEPVAAEPEPEPAPEPEPEPEPAGAPMDATLDPLDLPLTDTAGEAATDGAGESDTDLGAPEGTPAEHELLHADVEPAPERLAVVADAGDEAPTTPRPVRPRRGPARKKAAEAPSEPWVVADGGVCPPTHPVKAKLASRLFHLPGMFAYDRTRADRCYSDAESAVQDGFTSAKR